MGIENLKKGDERSPAKGKEEERKVKLEVEGRGEGVETGRGEDRW